MHLVPALRQLCERKYFAPVAALAFATVVCGGLVFARVFVANGRGHLFWVWNLLLAWLPLLLALALSELHRRDAARGWKFFALLAAWLLFFPNAPYVFTDTIHLLGWYRKFFWLDLPMVLLCSLTGLLLGFVSLWLVHRVVAEKSGRAPGWFFVALVCGLASVGIYIGRFYRFNSWDALLRPQALAAQLNVMADDAATQPIFFAIPLLYAVFLFTAYVMLSALTALGATDDQRELP
jgi:uncharacterized membrane protein